MVYDIHPQLDHTMKFSIQSRAAGVLLAAIFSAQAAVAQDPDPKPAPAAASWKWTGSFREVQVTSLTRGGLPTKFTGSVEIGPSSRGAASDSKFQIRLSAAHEVDQVDWGLSLGRCGSRLILQNTTAQMPPIQLRSGGSGELSQDLPMTLDPKSSYQLVLFLGGHDERNIASCANLRYEQRK
jgi:hypothetical protein